jgi:hypothetical protein
MASHIRDQPKEVVAMAIRHSDLVRRLAQVAGAVLLALAMVGFPPRAPAVGQTTATVGPAPSAGTARLWIYRQYEPYESLARPYLRLNGAIVAISEPGGAFYRDVPAGTYVVTVDSGGTDSNQFATVSVAPGQQAFVKVLVSNSWDSGGGGEGNGGGGGSGGWARDTFYTWQIEPQAAAAEISHLPLYNGS